MGKTSPTPPRHGFPSNFRGSYPLMSARRRCQSTEPSSRTVVAVISGEVHGVPFKQFCGFLAQAGIVHAFQDAVQNPFLGFGLAFV